MLLTREGSAFGSGSAALIPNVFFGLIEDRAILRRDTSSLFGFPGELLGGLPCFDAIGGFAKRLASVARGLLHVVDPGPHSLALSQLLFLE